MLRLRDTGNYIMGWLRHNTLGYDSRRVDDISDRYRRGEIGTDDAKKELTLAGFRSPMAEMLLLTLDNGKLWSKLIYKIESRPKKYQ